MLGGSIGYNSNIHMNVPPDLEPGLQNCRQTNTNARKELHEGNTLIWWMPTNEAGKGG
jgi:hypothetical protein